MTRWIAEFSTSDALLGAVIELRARGRSGLDTFTPFPVHGLDEALDARPSRLPWIVLVAGLLAAAGAYGLQWLITAYLYPVAVGGRPMHFPLAFVPITFEMGVLVAALAAVGAVLVLGRLVRLWDPVFDVDGFESATATRFWLAVDGTDAVRDELRDLGARRIREVRR